MTTPAHLSIVLHAHLPWVRHPEHEHHLEELWFYEAMHETYLPLLESLDRLERDEVPGTITVSLSAPLLEMLGDELLQRRFVDWIDRLIAFCDDDRQRADGQPAIRHAAEYYHDRLARLRDYYVDELDGDVPARFAHHADDGRVELMTCVGTHPILPFLATNQGRRAQIRSGLAVFEQTFHRRPLGMWLAECAFGPGVDKLLSGEHIAYSFVEHTGITAADSPPQLGTYGPIVTPEDVAFFGRDHFAGAQVWSADEGYPGDPVYREFYRDRAYDLPIEQVESIIHPDGIRHDTGLKYHRITGDVALDEKSPYRPQEARERAAEHARHFVESRLDQVTVVARTTGDRPLHITCPYDAELFGHWWFEGLHFLEEVVRQAANTDRLRLSSPAEYLREVDVHQQATPATSTWGEGSWFSVWLDESNAWIVRHLRNAEEKMVELVDRFADSDGDVRCAVEQAGRQLLLAQASDWPFIIKNDTTVEYANQRLAEHLEVFERLLEMIESDAIDGGYLDKLEDKYTVFETLELDWWKTGDR